MKEGRERATIPAAHQAAYEDAYGKLDGRLKTWWKQYVECEGDAERSGKMKGFNRVVLVGNLTRDPQVRELPSGIKVADLGLAASESYKKKDGETGERTCFVDLVAWAGLAEACGKCLRKGSPILVEGKLQYERWETSDGQKRNKIRVRADQIKFLGKPPVVAGEPAPALAGSDTDPMPF